MIDSALLYLKKNLSSVEDAYSKALLAYVFTLAGDTETRQQLLGELDKEADKTGKRDYFIHYKLYSGAFIFAAWFCPIF